MECAECGRPGTLVKTVQGAELVFCDAVCVGDYVGWLEVPEDMDPWARSLNKVLNELHAVHPYDQEACDFFEEWFKAITLIE